jgi:nucleotide-binding universal stress UspA family protein
MGPIVCATRGGEASRRTQEQAIALCRERGAALIFLFVADTNFDKPMNKIMTAVLADELERLGKTLLCIAQARAREHGIIAEMAVRRGPVRPTIEDFLREANASTLVIGESRTGSTTPAFAPGEIPQFAQDIHRTTGIEVVVVE